MVLINRKELKTFLDNKIKSAKNFSALYKEEKSLFEKIKEENYIDFYRIFNLLKDIYIKLSKEKLFFEKDKYFLFPRDALIFYPFFSSLGEIIFLFLNNKNKKKIFSLYNKREKLVENIMKRYLEFDNNSLYFDVGLVGTMHFLTLFFVKENLYLKKRLDLIQEEYNSLLYNFFGRPVLLLGKEESLKTLYENLKEEDLNNFYLVYSLSFSKINSLYKIKPGTLSNEDLINYNNFVNIESLSEYSGFEILNLEFIEYKENFFSNVYFSILKELKEFSKHLFY